MIILHAGNLQGRLALWGEVPLDNTSRLKTKKNKHRPHPFAASSNALLDVLSDLTENIQYESHLSTAWLPTKDRLPVASNELLTDIPVSSNGARISPWTIRTLVFDIHDAVYLLKTLSKKPVQDGIMMGSSLQYWFDVLRLAGSMVARQQFLPDIILQNDSYHAMWSPVFAGTYDDRLYTLATHMPASCRAITSMEETSIPNVSPINILVPFVSNMIDSIARTAMFGTHTTKSSKKSFDSPHDAWLYALESSDNTVHGDSGAISKLYSHVLEWHHPVAVSSNSPLRLCFRLVEPNGGTKWHIQYMVQSRDDPSLLVSAKAIYAGKTITKNSRGQKEFLLVSLGQAAELSETISQGLEDGDMSGFETNASGAYAFLHDAVALEQAGYGIMLPSWFTGKTKINVRANVKSSTMYSKSGISLDALVKLDWKVAIDDKNVTLKELERLAKMKVPLVKIRGQWIDAGGREIQTAIDMLKKGSKKATIRDIMMMNLSGVDASNSVGVKVTSSVSSITKILKEFDGIKKPKDLVQPKGFVGKMRPYQIRGYSWLYFLQKWGLGGCLADDMGLGKTIQMLALLQQYAQNQHGPVLLVCPTSLIENWFKEAAKFVPGLSVMTHHGSERKTGVTFKNAVKRHDLIITSYGLAYRDEKILSKIRWGGIVLDEAQNIKNYDTKQSRAVRSFNAQFKFAMTGTPVENNVGDLWSIMDFLNPGFLGTKKEFVENFFIPIQMGQDAEAAQRLRRVTGPFILRRLKTDKSVISDLPSKMEMKMYCQLTKEQASLYSSVLKASDEAIASAEGIQRKGMILAILTKLKQVCNHPAQFLKDNSAVHGRSGKMARLAEMLEEAIQADDKVLIFTQFVEMGMIIQKHIETTFGIWVPFLHGGTPRLRRAKMIDRFQEDDKDAPQVFVLSLKAGGTGLNLTAANRVIHFDRWWNPAVEDQATDRAFRIGQKRNVQVHKFICAGTLEERIDKMIQRKRQVSGEVIGSGEAWLTELSNDDLKDLISLKGVAVM